MTDHFLEKAKRRAVPINKIAKEAPFLDLFPINPDLVTTITEHMHQNGYDKNYPIIVWDRGNGNGNRQRYILVDGHTRLKAAQNVGMDSIYASCVTFPNEDTAFKYAIHNQRDRRNMTDADLFGCIEKVDNRKHRGGQEGNKNASLKTIGSSEPIVSQKSSAEQTANIVGTSATKVKKARIILDHADENTKASVKSGKKSINKGYKETQEKKKKRESQKSKSSEEKVTENLEFQKLHEEYELFYNNLIEFQISYKIKKKEWKKYLEELHRWTTRIQITTQTWVDAIEKPKETS